MKLDGQDISDNRYMLPLEHYAKPFADVKFLLIVP